MKNKLLLIIVFCIFLALSLVLNDLIIKKIKNRFGRISHIIIKCAKCVVFCVTLSLLFAYFLNAPNDTNYLSLIFGSISLITFIYLFFFVLNKGHNLGKKNMLLGLFLCIFSSIAQVVVEKYSFDDLGSIFVWMIIALFNAIGILLMLLGFKEVVK